MAVTDKTARQRRGKLVHRENAREVTDERQASYIKEKLNQDLTESSRSGVRGSDRKQYSSIMCAMTPISDHAG